MNWKIASMLAVATLGVGALSGCGKVGGGGSLATVNGDSISMDQYHDAMESMRTVNVNLPANLVGNIALTGAQAQAQAGGNKEKMNEYIGALAQRLSSQSFAAPIAVPLSMQVLNQLINDKLLIQLAKDEGVAPSDKDVEEELKFQTKLDPNYVKLKKAQGIQMGQLRRQTELALAQERLLAKGVPVTAANVDDEIKAIKKDPQRRAQLVEPATVEMLWIVVTNPQDKAGVDKELSRGQAFGSVAVRFSKDPNAERTQGRFQGGPVPIDRLGGQFAAIVNKTPQGRTTDWIEIGKNQFAKFQVVQKTEAKEVELTPDRKEFMRRQMAMQKGAQGKDVARKLRDKLLKAITDKKIVVNYEPVKDMWKNYSENLQKNLEKGEAAPSTPAAPAPAEGAK